MQNSVAPVLRDFRVMDILQHAVFRRVEHVFLQHVID